MKRLLLNAGLFAIMANAAQVADLYSKSDIQKIADRLTAKKGAFASQDLQRYGNHYTMVAHREATGSSEIHEREADIFIVQQGDSQIVTGGKIVGGHIQKPGEVRGRSIEGGETRPLKTGDVIHIPAGVAHQILISPGKPITYFVVKVSGQ